MSDEQKHAIEYAKKVLRGVKLYDLAASLAPTQGADAQTFVGKWRDVIKNMPDTYAQGADARPVAIIDVERKAIAKSVFGGINALRWILNITTEFDRKDVRARQAARLFDDHCTGEGTTNRAHLEHLWKTLNDALSLEDTLECLATRDAAPIEVPPPKCPTCGHKWHYGPCVNLHPDKEPKS
jgi:hypothetical protein